MSQATRHLPATMRAAVLTGPATINLQEWPVPVPGPDEVLVRVGAVGVCGSDVHYYRNGRIGDMVVTGPMVLGHEVGGRIVAVGSEVATNRLGERVAVEPQRPCRRCRPCKTGHLNLCAQMAFFATPPVDGSFCDFVTAPADFAHPVPDSVSEDSAALLEPLSVGLWAHQKAGTRAGSRVLVTGAGPIGAVTTMSARALGATEVIVSDPVAARRERIERLGATRTVDPTTDADLKGLDVDAFIECSGATTAVREGLRAVRSGGRAVLVGLGEEQMMLPVQDLQTREVMLTGVFRYVDTWPTAIALAASGAVGLDALVTGRFPLEETETALRHNDDPASMKSVVVVDEDLR